MWGDVPCWLGERNTFTEPSWALISLQNKFLLEAGLRL